MPQIMGTPTLFPLGGFVMTYPLPNVYCGQNCWYLALGREVTHGGFEINT